MLGQQGGGGVVARAKVRTVKVKIFFPQWPLLWWWGKRSIFPDLMKSFRNASNYIRNVCRAQPHNRQLEKYGFHTSTILILHFPFLSRTSIKPSAICWFVSVFRWIHSYAFMYLIGLDSRCHRWIQRLLSRGWRSSTWSPRSSTCPPSSASSGAWGTLVNN